MISIKLSRFYEMTKEQFKTTYPDPSVAGLLVGRQLSLFGEYNDVSFTIYDRLVRGLLSKKEWDKSVKIGYGNNETR